MDDREFLRRVRRYAKKTDLTVRFLSAKGKGSHGVVQVGSHDTTLKRGELGPGLLRKMLDQLRIRKEDF